MRTNILRTGISIVAACAVALGLAACGDGGGSQVPADRASDVVTDGAGDAVTQAAEAEVPPVVADASIAGMRVLLTNDDSIQARAENNSDGLGLYEMRKALCAAGADVVVIGPWAVQSGRGTAVTNSGAFTVSEPTAIPDGYADDCGDAPSGGPVYGLCLGEGGCTPESGSATPGDTVRFGFRGGLEALVGWEGYPDLVVSGPNSGLNRSSSVNDSGTVAAVISAVEHRVPGVAFSSASDADRNFPVENYAATSQYAVALLEALMSRDMLDEYEYALNVNYPDVTGGEPVGAAQFTEVGSSIGAYHYYTDAGGGTWTVGLTRCDGLDLCEEPKGNADVTALDGRAISIGAITPDRTYAPDEMHALESLAELRAFVAADAPAPIH